MPNRTTFRDRLDQSIRLASRHATKIGVLFIDLDRFKPVNDLFGHDIGDEALVHIAGELTHSLRQSDTIARIGGDEFAVVLPDIREDSEVLQVAQKLLEIFETPIATQDHLIHLNASIGAAVYPEHGSAGDVLLRHADLAMYHVKQAGGGSACLYSQGLSDKAEYDHSLETDLRKSHPE